MSEKRPSGDAQQQCPICGAGQPLSARKCSICGAVLPGELTPATPLPPVEAPGDAADSRVPRPRYDPALGDDDLYVGDLAGRMWRVILVGCVVLALALGLGLGMAISRVDLNGDDQDGGGQARVEDLATRPTVPPTATSRATVVVSTPTRTPDTMLRLPTVTPAPPTPTDSPTPGPCYQTAQSGDTVLGMAYRCGHRDMDVVPLILDINAMDSPEELQLGQTLEIPWPTPTPGGETPTVPPSGAGTGGVAGDAVSATPEVRLNEFGTPDALIQYQNVEPTLRPGLAWHTVSLGETILSIATQYDTTLETLSQINPEVPFLQCDYGIATGGENCSVMLYEGQRVRVPVPLPTLTPTSTPAGTLTPTPTASPTFNAPFLLAPEPGARFRSDEMVTLRWGGTGTLGPDDRYIVRVHDLTTGEAYVATVREPTYILPGGWQPDDRHRHTFEWTVSVGTVDAQNTVLSEDHETDARQFTWDSR